MFFGYIVSLGWFLLFNLSNFFVKVSGGKEC